MSGPLAANPNPYSIDLPDWLGDAGGKVYVTGAVSGLAFWQSSPIDFNNGDDASFIDISNAQVMLQKTDGWLQFYAQFGAYSLPTVGVGYDKATDLVPATFGYVPVAYAKLQGEGSWSAFSLEGGKLPTLIGDEYTFTFENMNIERGLLWNIEPAVSTGVQANYSSGPLNISVSWNDGTTRASGTRCQVWFRTALMAAPNAGLCVAEIWVMAILVPQQRQRLQPDLHAHFGRLGHQSLHSVQ